MVVAMLPALCVRGEAAGGVCVCVEGVRVNRARLPRIPAGRRAVARPGSLRPGVPRSAENSAAKVSLASCSILRLRRG